MRTELRWGRLFEKGNFDGQAISWEDNTRIKTRPKTLTGRG